MILVIVPAYGHAKFAATVLPHLQDDHVVLLCPGAVGGALQFYQELRTMRPDCHAIVGEAANLVYAAKRVKSESSPQAITAGDASLASPVVVRINGIKKAVPAAAIPADKTHELLAALAPVLPEFVAARDVLDTGLNNINVVVHPVLMLANLSRVEAGEEWFIFRNGFTPAVARLIETVDRERLTLLNALGLQETSVAQWMIRFYADRMKDTNLYEMLSSTPVFSQSVGPRSVRDRYLDEDVPYGLVPIAAIARGLNLPTSCTDGLIALASVISGEEFSRTGRTIERLGLAGLGPKEMIARVAHGR